MIKKTNKRAVVVGCTVYRWPAEDLSLAVDLFGHLVLSISMTIAMDGTS